MKFPWYKYEELPLSKRNTLQVFITNRCNLKCDGCFARNVMAGNELCMSIVEFQDTIAEAQRKGVEQINILGGEPLLHPDIISFCYYLRNRNIKTTIYTNGCYLNKYDTGDFYGAKLRVSLDSFMASKKAVINLVEKNWPQKVDANYMITTKTTVAELFNSANVLEDYGCKVFFIFSMIEMAHHRDFFYEHKGSLSPVHNLFGQQGRSGTKYNPHPAIPVLAYKALVHEFLEMYNGNMEIHISKRGVFESTKSLPHNKCKFANYFIGGKIIQCPYDVVNLKYQDDYEYDTRFCQQNSTCLMSKIKLQRKK